MSHDRGCPLVQAHNQILSYNLYDDDGDGNSDGGADDDWDQDLLSMLSVLWVSSLTSPLLSSL